MFIGDIKFTNWIEASDEFNTKSEVVYHIELDCIDSYECIECGHLMEDIQGSIMCEECGCMNTKEIRKDLILFRKLINSKWVHYKSDLPKDTDKFLRLIRNITKLDDEYWF